MSNQIKSCMNFLSMNGFLTFKNDRVIQLDTLGLLLKNNLEKQINGFYSKTEKFSSFKTNSAKDFSNFANTFFQNNTKIKTFALQYDQIEKKNCDSNIWENDQQILSTALFCKPELSLNFFHWMQSQRHRFWRGFASCPNNFSNKEFVNTNSFVKQIDIDFKKNDLSFKIESIFHCKNNNNQINQFLNVENEEKFLNFDLILCKTFISNSVIAYLADAYADKQHRSLLFLNEFLVPYQFGIAVVDEQLQISTNVKDAVGYIFEEIKNLNLTAFPFMQLIDSMETSFKRFDNIGALYTIVVQEKTLQSGFVYLRSRDTELMENIHISNLKFYLPLYSRQSKPLEMLENFKNQRSKL